ncbi:hypothetical protein DRO66_00320 [Candidatus Bathyarchaeota archaeon]|nr:MAG: hypothetical protein DRO66_00320 [Candidatus Bathyarchaeota archaeon]
MFDINAITAKVEGAFRDAANDTLATMSERIFIDGGNSAGGKIGEYSVKPYYANPKTSPTATNKTGKTGKTIQGGYYKGGYKEFRAQQGRESGFINQRLTNNLQSDFNNAESGFVLQQTGDLTYSIVIDRPENIRKIEGQEKRFGPIFTELTKDEELLMLQSLEFNLNNRFKTL